MNASYDQQAVNDKFWSEQKVFVMEEDRTNRENTFAAVVSSVALTHESILHYRGRTCLSLRD